MVFKNHLKNCQNHCYTYKHKVLQGKLAKLTESFEESYYKRLSQKLSSISSSSKCYWSLQKRMLNEKKIPVIPPLFHNNNFMSNLKEKTKFSMNIFLNSSLIQNRSSLIQNRSTFHKSLSSFQFSTSEIKSIINKLAPNKARGHTISIRMINLRGGFLYKPLDIIFYILFKLENFSSRMEEN